MWIERRDAGAAPSLRHSVSRDQGKEWSPWSDAPYAGAPHITAMPAGRDGVNVFYTMWDRSGPSHSEVMCWNGSWDGPVRLGGRLRFLDPHPVEGGAAQASLVTTEVVPGSPRPTYRVTWLERSATDACAAGRDTMPCRK